jgi:hypothetical protein
MINIGGFMVHNANMNENLTQLNRVWLVRDLTEPVIGSFKRIYKDPRDNGHRLEYRGVNISEDQVNQIAKIIAPYQSKVKLRSNKKYDQILQIRIYETVE